MDERSLGAGPEGTHPAVSASAPRHSLRGHTLYARFLLALVLIGVLPLGVVGLGVAALDRQALAEHSARELTGLARGLAGQLDVHLDDLLAIARGLAALPAIVSMDPAQQAPLLQEQFLYYPMFHRLATFDLAGHLVASSAPTDGTLVGDAVGFLTAAAQGREVWDVQPAPAAGRVWLILSVPVRTAARDTVGVLSAVVDLEDLELVVERVPVGNGGRAYVLDARGQVVLHPVQRLIQERADFSGLGIPLGSRPAGPGIVRYEMDAEPRVAAYAPTGNIGWTVVVERPEQEVVAPAERSWQLALAGLAASATLALLAAVWLARALTRPVRELAAAARAFGAGDPAAPLPAVPPADSDLQALIEAFAAMRRAVVGREVERAQLLAREQAARAEAETAEQRFAFLAEASTRLAASFDHERTLADVACLAVPYLADWCSIELLEADGTRRIVAVARIDPVDPTRALLLSADAAAAEGAPPVLAPPRAAEQTVYWPDGPDAAPADEAVGAEHLRALGARSVLAMPLRTRARTLGTITLVATSPGRRYSPDHLALVEDLARRCALAVDNALLYREARDAVRARDRFLSIASHELRTPLTGIKGFAQVLLAAQARGQLASDRLQRSLQRIDDACNRLGELIEDLLDVSRLRTGHLHLRPAPLDLAGLVREVADRHRPLLGPRQMLTLDLPALPCLVMADRHRLEQVLANLIENAAKYSPDGGTIRITLTAQSDRALLSVTDEGIGLPEGAAATIFEPFGRASNATERHIPGMGLGLYICQEIIARHGGQIWAESPGEGRGTTVWLWLPLAGEGPAPQ